MNALRKLLWYLLLAGVLAQPLMHAMQALLTALQHEPPRGFLRFFSLVQGGAHVQATLAEWLPGAFGAWLPLALNLGLWLLLARRLALLLGGREGVPACWRGWRLAAGGAAVAAALVFAALFWGWVHMPGALLSARLTLWSLWLSSVLLPWAFVLTEWPGLRLWPRKREKVI